MVYIVVEYKPSQRQSFSLIRFASLLNVVISSLKLLFDVVCTLTDMDYIVYHATINTSGDQAYQEFYMRHTDGTPIISEAEREGVRLCLQAAIQRREFAEDVRLELCTEDKRGLLAEVTRTFMFVNKLVQFQFQFQSQFTKHTIRENGLNLTRAEISTTRIDRTHNVFYVTDAAGRQADTKLIDSVRRKIGMSDLKVKKMPAIEEETGTGTGTGNGVGGAVLLTLGSIVRRNLYNLGLIASFS